MTDTSFVKDKTRLIETLFSLFLISMRQLIHKLITYLKVDLWKTSPKDVSPVVFMLINTLRQFILAIRFFTTRRVVDMASALTYSTLLAIVPIVAVVFAIARGFGFSKYIEIEFRNAFSSQPLAAEAIIGFVNSYLAHTQGGVLLGIGLVFMLFTILNLTSNIEKTFNAIWEIENTRSLFRTVTDYLTMFFLTPIVVILTSGLSILLATYANNSEVLFLGPAMRGVLTFMPYVLMSAIFVGLYMFMPNTKVNLKSALLPGILAGVAMQMLQLVYINSQIFLSSYNAIYGSFAALPLFMLWLQISWTICLFGVELCYTNQNMEHFDLLEHGSTISHRYKILLASVILSKIAQRFEKGQVGYTALELKLETQLSMRVILQLLSDMQKAKVIIGSQHDEKEENMRYYPAICLSQLTVGLLVDRLEALEGWKLEMDLQEQMKSPLWSDVLHIRQDYLTNLRTIHLKDL